MATHADSVTSTPLAIPAIPGWSPTSSSIPPESDFQVFLNVSPAGGVVEPNGGNPAITTTGLTSTQASEIYNGLSTTQNAQGEATSQLLAVAFGAGLPVGGSVTFPLDVSSTLTTPPQLSIDQNPPYGTPIPGLEIINPTSLNPGLTASGQATATYTIVDVATPEPLSITLWLTVFAAALFNVRRMRRNHVAVAGV
jgi:hypothetical protein